MYGVGQHFYSGAPPLEKIWEHPTSVKIFSYMFVSRDNIVISV
jgi:hypothetical protein